MKKSPVICLFMAFLMLISPLSVAANAVEFEENAVTDGFYSFDAGNAYLGSGQLVENVGAAILYEVGTDSLMYAWNPDVQMHPSSLVKILTALIAVENGDLETVITVDGTVLETVPSDAVSVDLLPGEQLTLSDLLYCMMVGSGNDAAAVIAHHICGSQEEFVVKMNEYAEDLGCTATNFTNVHGLHDADQYTTARDMGRILAAAMKNENFMMYFGEVWYRVPATNLSEERSLATGNFLMNNDVNNDGMVIYYDSRVTGGRTGISNDGNRCLASSAEQNGMVLACVVLGCESTFAEDGNTQTYGSFKETSALLDAGFEGYKVSRVLYDGQSVRQLSVNGGECDVVIGSKSSVQTILPSNMTAAELRYQYKFYNEELTAPIKEGERICQLQIWNGNICVAQADLFAMNDVDPLSAGNDTVAVTVIGDTLETTMIWIAIVTAVVVLVVLFLRYGGKLKAFFMRRRTRRYRKNRRRSS